MLSKLLSGIVCVVCLVAAAGASAADKVTFNLGFLPNGANALLYVGIHQGLFAAENLDVTILPGRGATDTLTKVATGVADLGEVSFEAFLAAKAESQVPVKAVMPYFTRPPDSLVTTTATGIATLKDVVGRTVATSPFAASNLVWPVLLKQNGIDPASVTLIKADPNTFAGMLATGRVDAVISWATTTAMYIPVLTAAGKTIKIIPWSGSGYEGYSQTYVASDRMITSRPDVLRRFLKVVRQAIYVVNENPVAAACSLSDISGWRAGVLYPLAGGGRESGAAQLDLLGPRSGCWPHDGEVAGGAGFLFSDIPVRGRRWSSGDRRDRRCGRCGATGSTAPTAPIETALTVGCGVLSLRHFRLASWCSLSLGGWWPRIRRGATRPARAAQRLLAARW